MFKLNSQFDRQSRHSTESAAAGGSTSSSCSCCLVTLAVSTVATSMHFYTLKEVVPTAALGGSAIEGKTTLSGGPNAVIGALLPVLSLVVAGLTGAMVHNSFVATCAALMFWTVTWVAAYGYAERSRWRGLITALIGFAAIMAACAVELRRWNAD